MYVVNIKSLRMASRWRTWDAQFATDILDNQLPFDSLDSMPIGTRGKLVFNISPKMLTLPIIHSFEKSDSKVGGRGKRLHDQNQSKDMKLHSPGKVVNKSNNNNLRKNWHEQEFPSLAQSKNIKTNNNTLKKTKTLSGDTKEKEKTLEDLLLQFQDAEMTEKTDTMVKVENDSSLKMEDQNSKQQSSILKDKREIINEGPMEKSTTDFKNKRTESEVDFIENMSTTSHDDIVDKSSVVSNEKSESSFFTGFKIGEQSFTSEDFLKSLEEPEYYILIEGLTIEADLELFKELITSFGEIDLFLNKECSDGLHQNVIVRMKESSNCDWVVSCLDGDIYEEDSGRLSAKTVDSIVS